VSTSVIDRLVAGLPFEPDRFQKEAFAVIAAGESVIVAAPTASGKTLVAEAAIEMALAGGRRAFYTTPIKALSNQKYRDFGRRWQTGLLTGDNSIAGDSPVVVMTTEVLRNMIYAGSGDLSGLGTVVLDEVHYLQDPERGPVWEEIIIHLPRDIPIVGLSATVANAQEFTDWVAERRGGATLVIERERPVPLRSTYLVHDKNSGNRLFPLFRRRDGRTVPNGALVRLLKQGSGKNRRRRFHTPRRVETVEALLREDLLPAIYFIFSRRGCEAAAEQVSAHLRFTSEGEAAEIKQRAESGTAHLSDSDLTVLGYGTWLERLTRGIAAHHAGMVPAFKEVVEDLFTQGLIRVVFATETLALGINMPARSVVIESLSKYNGETHELLTPGEYTQLTGRAGRRGIDEEGVAVVLHSPYVPIERVAAIAGRGALPLRSSFRPTYNMAVNLVANYPQHEAETLLRASFAQYQRSSETRIMRDTIERKGDHAVQARRQAECDRGDVFDYVRQLREGSEHLPSIREVMRRFASETNPGDVLELPEREGPHLYVLLARGRTRQPRLQLLSELGRIRRIKAEDLPLGTTALGHVELPKPFRPNDRDYQERVLELVRSSPLRPGRVARVDSTHPVGECPELHEHVKSARRALRLEREVKRHQRALERLEGDLVRELRTTLAVLDEWGYTAGWTLTEKGERLRLIYNSQDLLVAEAVAAGAFDGLAAPDFAALATLFVYEPRADVEPWDWPNMEVERRADIVRHLHQQLVDAEQANRLSETDDPHGGFTELAHGWASGWSLEHLFGDEEFTPGDFVRSSRQLLDLLRQLRDAYPHLASVASEALRAVERGVVAAEGVV
jgi:ATP-dependent RNA helicase HelY